MNILSIIPGLTSLASELIADPDKRVEYAFKTQELLMNYQSKIVQTKTTPKVDAGVKVLYALADVGQKLWRPLISGFAFLYGIIYPEGIAALPEYAQAAIYGAFPAWGASRHVQNMEKEKNSKKKSPPAKAEEDMDWDED